MGFHQPCHREKAYIKEHQTVLATYQITATGQPRRIISDGKGSFNSDSLRKADIILQQYRALFTKPMPGDSDDLQLPNVNIRHPLQDIEINNTRVTILLRDLNTSKSCGPDAIPNTFLMTCTNSIATGLVAILQHSLHWHVIKRRQTSMFKKGDRHLTENYIFISLTCVSCKLLEYIICRHCMRTWRKTITGLNHGFMSEYSCESQLVITMNDLLWSYDASKQVDCVVLDILLHSKLHMKLLRAYDITGHIHAWLTHFISTKSMRVVLEGDMPEKVPVESAVLQETVLVPYSSSAY